MKSTAVLLLTFILMTNTSKAQIDEDVLNILRSDLLNIDVYELIFSENELVYLCKDSVGQDLVGRYLGSILKSIPLMDSNKARTELIALNMLLTRISATRPTDEITLGGREFLLNQLNAFDYDFDINEELGQELFDHSKRDLATKGVCDVGVSMYIIFIYDPLLYLKLIKMRSKDVFFPLACTITEYDRPFCLRKRMQVALLKMLSNYKVSKELKNISKEISRATITGSND